MTRNFRLTSSTLLTLLVTGCAMFSQTPTNEVQQMVADNAPPGSTMDSAEAGVSAHGFSCNEAHGSFIDTYGREHNPKEFVTCTEKPPRFAFTCAYRNYVYLIPKQGTVDEVYVVRGPNCLDQ
jgi:hypothetical protein